MTIVLALVGGHLAECQGWLATPEARMACCANEQECPMHQASHRSSASRQVIGQSDADRCCATSEHGSSMPSSIKATSMDSLALMPVGLPVVVDAVAISFDRFTERAPSPPPSRARHVLLTVFLI